MVINRRQFVKTSTLALGMLPFFSSCGKGKRKPNIVLVMADDQGWGDMGYNGHPMLKTPHFDEMAASPGIRFDRFYAAAPVCSPTRGSIMTGRHPNRFGCFKWGHTLRPQEITLPEALHNAGYTTGHFGKWHLGSVRTGSPVNPGTSGFDEWFSAPNFFDNNPVLSDQGKAVQTQGESSMVTVDAAIDFIRRRADEPNPFLAVVWFGSPHNPHEALEQYRTMYPDEEEGFQHFYGEITAMDEAFGKLRGELRNLGIHENTILWYCSDNGGLPNFGSTGGRGHKGQIYEGGLRVPALLEWPGRLKDNFITNVPCNTSDIYPTLLDIAGIKVKNQPPLDGISLTPLLEEQMDARPRPMGFWDYAIKGIPTPSKSFMAELLAAQGTGDMVGDSTKLRLEAAVIKKQYAPDTFPGHAAWLDWPWKLHRIEDESGDVRFELFHLKEDPDETKDLSRTEADRLSTMKKSLESWQVSVVNSLNGNDY